MILKTKFYLLNQYFQQTSIEERQFRIAHPAAIFIDNEENLNKVQNCCKPLLSIIIL